MATTKTNEHQLHNDYMHSPKAQTDTNRRSEFVKAPLRGLNAAISSYSSRDLEYDSALEFGVTDSFVTSHENVNEFGDHTCGECHDQTVGVTTASIGENGDDGRGALLGKEWRTGFGKRFPWMGGLALLGSLCCTSGAITVLETSDGVEIDLWGGGSSISPSVYLAVISVLSNIMLLYALTHGVIITFWRTTLDGCTLSELHHTWSSGTSFMSAGRNLFRPRTTLLALASILTTVSVIRGPFNQRATSILTGVLRPINGTLVANIAPRLPDGYVGIDFVARYRSYDTSRLTPNFTQVMRAYSRAQNMTMTISPGAGKVSNDNDINTECATECRLEVRAFGFGVNCTADRETTQLDLLAGGGASYMTFRSNSSLNVVREGSDDQDPKAYITLQTYYMSEPLRSDTSNSSFSVFRAVNHKCDLRGSVVKYNVKLAGGVVSLENSTWQDDIVLETLNLSAPYFEGGQSIIGGLSYAADYLFNSTAYANFGGARSAASLSGPLANQYVVEPVTGDNDDGSSIGFLRFTDPMEDMIAAMREIAFRASLQAAEDNPGMENLTQVAAFTGSRAAVVYATDRGFMIASAVVSMAAIAAVGATFWGWWKIGRIASLSPLEVANAFGTPLLRAVDSNSSVKQILAEEKRFENIEDGTTKSTRSSRGVLRYGEVLAGNHDEYRYGKERTGSANVIDMGRSRHSMYGRFELRLRPREKTTRPRSGVFY